jgi:hypothetical protein
MRRSFIMATTKKAETEAKKETKTAAKAAEKTTKTATKTAAKTAAKAEEKKAPAKKTAAKKTATKTAAKAEEKKAPAKKPAAKKPAAKKTTTKAAAAKTNVEVFVEFGGTQVAIDDVIKNVKLTNGKAAKNITIYLKPEESKAYFVADGDEKEMDVFFC